MREFVISTGDRFLFHVTTVIATCADGTTRIPPQVAHAGKRLNANIVENIPEGFCIHLSPNGSQYKAGFERFCKHFINHARKGMDGNTKTTLYLDGHNSRWTYSGLVYLADGNVIVIRLPSHTSVTTQPNDNGINQQFHEDTVDATKERRQEMVVSGFKKAIKTQ